MSSYENSQTSVRETFMFRFGCGSVSQVAICRVFWRRFCSGGEFGTTSVMDGTLITPVRRTRFQFQPLKTESNGEIGEMKSLFLRFVCPSLGLAADKLYKNSDFVLPSHSPGLL